MPSDLGPPASTPSEAEKSEALEALAARQRLTREQTQTLTAVGVTAADQARHSERPWGSADNATTRRLARVRGWSPAAIAAFLHRTEAQVEAALSYRAGDGAGRRP